MFKKALALLVVATMLLALATACTPKTSTSASASAAKTTAKSSAAAATTAKPSTSGTVSASATTAPTDAPILPTDAAYVPTAPPVTINPSIEPTTPPEWTRPPERAIDLQGRIVEVRGHYGTINYYTQANPNDPNNAVTKMYNKMRATEEKYKFTFSWIPFVSSGWRVTVNFNDVSLAGGDWADVVWVQYRYAFPVQAVRNLVKPLDTLFDFNNDPVYNVRFIRTGALFKGRVWGLQAGPYSMPDLGMFYRKNLLDALGLPDPITLYNEGNWTWDTFFNIAVQATRDFNNDGVIDQWGLNGDVYRVYSGLLYSNGGRVVSYDGDTQTFSIAFEKPAAMKAILKINEIVNTLKITKAETFMISDGDTSFNNSQAVFLMAGLPGHFANNPQVLWMALPRGPDYTTGTMAFIREINYWGWTSTIGEDWQDVITATAHFFSRDYDYIYWDDVDKAAIWNETNYANAIRPTWPGPGDAEHIARLVFVDGTEVLDSPAWKNVFTIITDKIIQKVVVQNVPVITAIDMHRDECIAQLNAETLQ